MVNAEEVEGVVFVGVVFDGGEEAVEPVVTRFRYESVTTVAVAPQNMMYWSSRALLMMTQAGAVDGLDHGGEVSFAFTTKLGLHLSPTKGGYMSKIK